MKQKHILSDGKRTIIWKGEQCMHKALCLRGILEDMDIKENTIHSISSAQVSYLLHRIEICPSGAIVNAESAE
ncbi:MAG TPA: (4Fe-4S)-binding protein [Bacteroidales bacterium]|nr:(4Fe-4S)-binding protein [Bacteroidales bacterium]HPT03406.1 (4Fe-4S)-binding protein [Bacteroidales bacterium]